MIGKSVLRFEDQKFLSGAGRFIEDISLPGELYCAIVRSPHAHARILGIRAPEGVQLLTGEDMAREQNGITLHLGKKVVDMKVDYAVRQIHALLGK